MPEASGRLVTVRRYRPGEHQPPHVDPYSRITVVLGGAFEEEGRDARLRMGPGDVLLKSRRVAHEDTFGRDGAVVLSVAFTDDDPFDLLAPLWGRPEAPGATRVATVLLEAALAQDGVGLEVAAADLLLASGQGDSVRASDPPAWLSRLRIELEQCGLAQVDVAVRAREAGVHAAHASRLFRRCFGVSITEHAQASAVRRAVSLMAASGAALSDVAVAAGFYDQSHMSRVFRRVSGRPPAAHRTLLRRAATLLG